MLNNYYDYYQKLKNSIGKKYLGIILMLMCTVFASTGQVFFKFASEQISLNPLLLIQNIPLMIGLFSYGLGAVLFTVALRLGDLSLLFPLLALNFVWVMILSSLIFSEVITGFKILATIFIIIGVSFIGVSQ